MTDTIALNMQIKQLIKLLTTVESECEALEKEYDEIQTLFEQVYEGVDVDRCNAIQELKETLDFCWNGSALAPIQSFRKRNSNCLNYFSYFDLVRWIRELSMNGHIVLLQHHNCISVPSTLLGNVYLN